MKGDGKGEDGKTGRSQKLTDFRDLYGISMTCFLYVTKFNDETFHSWCFFTHLLKGFSVSEASSYPSVLQERW